MHLPPALTRRAATTWLLGVALLPSASAWANPVSRLYENMARSKKRFATPQDQVRAEPTLIHGLYRLVSRQGDGMGFVNAAGTLYGSANGFTYIPPQGGGPRPLSPAEQAAMQKEMLAALDTAQLIRVPYGDGGGRRLLLLSALDCPVCKKLEAKLLQLQDRLNTTFYIAPLSLRAPDSAAGPKAWGQVARLWCAPDRAQAWQTYWRDGSLPTASDSACAFNSPQKAARAYLGLHAALLSAGVEIKGTPTLLLEDGRRLPFQSSRSDADWLRQLGPQTAPAQAAPAPQWL